MEKEGFKFDLETQRFIENRWESDLGKRIRKELIEGINACVEIRAILDDYVLDHPENIAPYSHPIYPRDAMLNEEFWVLTSDDLRGIHFYNEDFAATRSLERKSLGYSRFYNCDLSQAELACADFSYANFVKCNMKDCLFAQSGGFSVRIIECDLTGASLWGTSLREPDFSDSNLSGAYFESALFKNMIVSHRTKFDHNLKKMLRTRKMPIHQSPDILRSIRIAYNDAEIWDQMDSFLFAENVAKRKYVLWPALRDNNSVGNFAAWFLSLLDGVVTGYSTKPFRIIISAFSAAIFFAVVYFSAGTPNGQVAPIPAMLESIYFSMTTFATLGYGDISYSDCRPIMRLVSTLEAWSGAIAIALFVVALSRKVFR